MRILLLSVKSQKSYGGIATWTEYFLEACNACGVEVDLVNTVMVGKRMENASALINVFDEYKRTKRIFTELKRCLKVQPGTYAAAHLNTSCGVFGIFRDYLAARRIKKKKLLLVTHYHCDIKDWVKNPVSKHFLKKLCEISDKNVVLCESSEQYLEENFGVSSIKMANFVNDSMTCENNKVLNEEIRKAVFVGRISKIKGALEVFELAKRFPEIEFELIGKLDEDVSKSVFPNNAKIVGVMPHDELIEYLGSADIFLLPSHSEGFSLALTEAMSRGVPAVATDVGANKEMLSDGCGIVTSVGDVDAMEKGIAEMSSLSERTRMSQNSVKKVQENYVSSVVIDKILKLYE